MKKLSPVLILLLSSAPSYGVILPESSPIDNLKLNRGAVYNVRSTTRDLHDTEARASLLKLINELREVQQKMESHEPVEGVKVVNLFVDAIALLEGKATDALSGAKNEEERLEAMGYGLQSQILVGQLQHAKRGTEDAIAEHNKAVSSRRAAAAARSLPLR